MAGRALAMEEQKAAAAGCADVGDFLGGREGQSGWLRLDGAEMLGVGGERGMVVVHRNVGGALGKIGEGERKLSMPVEVFR